MGLIDFVKSAGEKLFGRGKAQTAMAEMQAAPADPAKICLLYTSPSPRDGLLSRMPSSA